METEHWRGDHLPRRERGPGTALKPGTTLAGFRIEALIGRGATASVYRAYQFSLQRDVALKVLAPQLTTDPGFVARFRREGVHLARLQHEAIVTVYEAGSDRSYLFLAMQLIEGRSLKERLADAGALEAPEVLAILDRVGAGLDFAHRQGFIHRDVKPANILLDTSGRAYLADFGLIKALTQPGASTSGELVGTPIYMAPEQSAGKSLTGRTDLYSLACVGFECLTGTPPYSGDDIVALLLAHAADSVPEASCRNPALPTAVDEVFRRAMAKDPADRHDSVTAFLTDLRAALAAPEQAPPAAPAPEPTRLTRRSVLLGGVASAALVTGGALWWVSSGREQSSRRAAAAIPNITQISAGGYHNLVLLGDGTIEAWGDNSGGKLGDGTTVSHRSGSVVVSGLTGATALDASVLHSLALLEDGTVRAWGENQFGQLGDGGSASQTIPAMVPGLTEVIAVAAGGFFGTDGRVGRIRCAHSLALLADGTVKAWGSNNDGQLGDGTTTNRSTPVLVPGLADATALSAGATHSLALLEDGTVRAWGDNGLRGETGDDNSSRAASTIPVAVPGLAGVVAIAAGCFHSVALLGDGTVVAWGWNGYAQLGDGTTVDRPTAVVVPGIAGVTAVAAGDRFSLALLGNGEVRTWGANELGQLGDGSFQDRPTPGGVEGLTTVRVATASFLHCLALLEDGTVKAWGDNSAGELGDGSTDSRKTPVTVTSLIR
ncbi:MAG: putative serine/threonine-protein kinase pknL [Modestobacter sp.]|nr:putative serine/threonine-protein kinase pknL [Modestobacter sp.]